MIIRGMRQGPSSRGGQAPRSTDNAGHSPSKRPRCIICVNPPTWSGPHTVSCELSIAQTSRQIGLCSLLLGRQEE